MQSASVRIRCPQCDKTYRLQGLSLGQKARCHCGHAFTVTQDMLASPNTKGHDTASGHERPGKDPLRSVQSLAQAKDAILNEVGPRPRTPS
jgi:hypothetical protein